ncbi:hypothetical protein R1sor_007738 [Riccia sorocarpa]|uniref:HTH CENPB-type domain-containing protein n=1 Tax=Riccia sorocarpa TaxID=122646 RepID=A0ABD3HU70_9MARC
MTNRSLSAWACSEFQVKVSEPTVCRILKKQHQFLTGIQRGDRKRKKECLNPELEESLYRWFLALQQARVSISDELIMVKARLLHDRMIDAERELKDCKYTNGWAEGFKRRHNIRLRIKHAPTQSTLADQVLAGEKKDKEHITVALTSNMDGSIKFPPLVINKSKMPRAFSGRGIRNPGNLGIQWFYNKKAWMTGAVFETWLLSFDLHLANLGRKKVILLLDTAPGHIASHLESKLQVTKVIFLPPNTTSRFQPMDAGILKSFKAQYRKLSLLRHVEDFKAGKVTKLDVYDAVIMSEKAWRIHVTVQTIKNCWMHTGLVHHVDSRAFPAERDLDLNLELADGDLEHQIEDITQLLDRLSIFQPMASTDNRMETEEYLDIDDVHNASTFDLDDLLTVPELENDEVEAEDEELMLEAETIVHWLDVQLALNKLPPTLHNRRLISAICVQS